MNLCRLAKCSLSSAILIYLKTDGMLSFRYCQLVTPQQVPDIIILYTLPFYALAENGELCVRL